LETDRLRLRQFTRNDIDLLVELDSDPEVMRYITFGVPTPRASYADVFLPRWCATRSRRWAASGSRHAPSRATSPRSGS
jgi:RimJ/RimL family protein N-acetyltransferase